LQHGARRIVVVDDLSSGHAWLLPEDPRVQFLNADVCDLSTLELELERPYVFHLAAFFANQNSVDHPHKDLHTNGQGTLAALEWAAAQKAKRFVYASAGCSIAGHGISEPIREDMPVSLFLDTPYQITKALGEFYCNYFNPMVSTARARFFNSYGPGEVPGRYRNVIPNFIWLALHNRPLPITGTGEETRDFIFVSDLVQGLLLAAANDRAGGEAFNLGTGFETKIIDLAKQVIELTDSSSEIIFLPRRPWDKSAYRRADVSHAKDLLGFSAKTAVSDGLRPTVEWFRTNFDKIAASIGEPL
jgi:nucleoside-diphosphate-sugar epimerase